MTDDAALHALGRLGLVVLRRRVLGGFRRGVVEGVVILGREVAALSGGKGHWSRFILPAPRWEGRRSERERGGLSAGLPRVSLKVKFAL